MAGYFGVRNVNDIYAGTTRIQAVYLGTQQLWQRLVAHTHSTTSNVNVVRHQWTRAHSYVVVGQGAADITCAWLFDWTAVYTSKHIRSIRLLKNGVKIVEWSQGDVVRAGTWESARTISGVELSEGDIIIMEAFANANNSNLRRLTEHSFQITPT